MKKLGVTLLELLVVLTISAILGFALSRAWISGVRYQEESSSRRQASERVMRFEERVRSLLAQAYLSPTATDTTTFFIGEPAEGASGTQANSLVFTAAGERIRGAYLTSEEDFPTLNQRFGPQGGSTEVSLSVTPVGNVSDQSGLFLREQRPSDGDPTQGGFESLLDPDIQNINFEFFDGLSWQENWNTTSNVRRLPAAVRMTYSLADEENDRILIVALPNSDVTPDNPATQTATAGDQG